MLLLVLINDPFLENIENRTNTKNAMFNMDLTDGGMNKTPTVPPITKNTSDIKKVLIIDK